MRRAAAHPVAFFSSDGVAVLPRWMADAYAEFWRYHGAGCVLPAAWHRDGAASNEAATAEVMTVAGARGAASACDGVLRSRRDGPSNGAPTHFFFIAAGLLGIDLHHFWRHASANGTSSTGPVITLLRRPGLGCMQWS